MGNLVTNGSAVYEVGAKVGDKEEYHLYLCNGNSLLLQIASNREHNRLLERAAYNLRELKRKAQEVEAEFAKVKTDPTAQMNYDIAFPVLVDSFISKEQGNRRVNILAFKNVDDVRRMVPLSNLIVKDKLRVDLRTSAWLMGKLLKTLAFAHSEGIAVNVLSWSNILFEPNEHYILIFDWASARAYPGSVPAEDRRSDISEAASSVISALGGNYLNGDFPADEVNKVYTDYLLSLSRGSRCDAQKAHSKFYQIVDSIWPREYYPFTTKRR